MNRKIFILLCVFILSRLIFINYLPVFFDAPEYLDRLSNPDYFNAIISGHLPLHIGYILLYWPIFHFAIFFGISPSLTIILAQIVFSTIGIYCFYRFTEIITNNKIALLGTLIAILTPLYWIMNVSIMTESTYVNFFLISLFFLVKYGKEKNHSKLFLLAACFFFVLTLLTHPLVVLWLPFLISLIYFFRKGKIFITILELISAVIIAFLINSFFVAKALHVSYLNGVHKYLFDQGIAFTPAISSFLILIRFIRNAVFPLLQNNTAVIFFLGLTSLILKFNEDRKLFIVGFLWLLPSLIINQCFDFDALLFGRHAVITGFGLAFFAAVFLEKRKLLSLIVILYILISSLPALTLLKQPIPYLTEQKFVQHLPKGLLIESHFARPQVQGYYSGEIIFVNQPTWNENGVEMKIDSFLNKDKPVFVTSQALSDPYGLYSGPFIHMLSLSYARKYALEDVIKLYSLDKYATVDKQAGLEIYKVSRKVKSPYPKIQKLTNNRHRIDFYDPLSRLLTLPYTIMSAHYSP